MAKVAYQYNYRADLFADATGISIGIPAELKLGPIHLLLCPELIVSFTKVSYNPAETLVTGFYAWLYGRIGLYFEEGLFKIGASISLRTTPFDEGFALELPFQTAVELIVYIPDSPLYISAIGALEFESSDSYFGLAGIGFGLLW
jgi:hypothetical protein